MEGYKQEFIEFMVECDVLKFGEFTLKSGRKSPFFMNAGAYVTGGQLKKLGEYYAKAIHENFGDDFDRHTREYRSQSSRRSLTMIFTERRSATVRIARK